MNYQAVFWDWNGTLLDDTHANLAAVNISLQKRGMPPVTPEVHSEVFCFPVIEYYEKIGFDFTKISYDELAAEFMENYLAQKCDLRKNAKRTLEKLFLNSVKQYVLSACEKNILVDALTQYDLNCYFTDVIALDDIKANSKIEVGKRYLREHPIEGKLLMIGDTHHDIEVAKALGMDCILVESGNLSRRRMEETGVRIAENLFDVAEIVLGKRNAPKVDYMTPERAERRNFDISETTRRFSETYHDFYDDVKNTNKTEDW